MQRVGSLCSTDPGVQKLVRNPLTRGVKPVGQILTRGEFFWKRVEKKEGEGRMLASKNNTGVWAWGGVNRGRE